MKSIKELYAFDYIPEIPSIQNVDLNKAKLELKLVISVFGDVCAVSLSDVNKMLTAETITVAEPLGIEIDGER